MPRINRSLDVVHRIEALEARALFSAYLYSPVQDALSLHDPIHVFEPPDLEAGSFGTTVMGLGDIDGDGVPDLAISAPGAPPSDFSPPGVSGRVFLHSGASGALIRTLADMTPEFGVSMANLGDLNSDGVPDLLIGSPGYDATDNDLDDPTGRAYVYSGADGALLRTFDGVMPDGDFGRAVSRLNDANSDGTPDIIIGAPGRRPTFILLPGDPAPPPPTMAGEVFIFSGADGALIRSHMGEHAGDRFGAAIAAGLPTGDHQQFFAIGAPDVDGVTAMDAGRVYVFTVAGDLAYTLDGENAGDSFGAALAIAPTTVDFSGPPGAARRLIVGVPGSDSGVYPEQPEVADRGRIESFNLPDGMFRVIGEASEPAEGARMGSSIVLVSDLDFDGADDIAVLSRGSGQVHAFTASLNSFNDFGSTAAAASLNGLYHQSLGLVGDVNDDGIPDLVVGTVSQLGEISVRVVSSLGIGPPLLIEGVSPNLRYMWVQSSRRPILFIDGVPRSLDRLPGLSVAEPGDTVSPTSHIEAIDSDGTIYFVDQNAEGARSDLMVWRDGVVVTLESLVTSVQGQAPQAYGELRVVKVGSEGHLLLQEGENPSGQPTPTYVFHDGVLSFVWLGFVHDVNASGAVVGAISSIDLPAQAGIWTPEGGATAIPELTGLLAINDAGVVVGTRTGTNSRINAGTLATWNNGVVTDLATPPNTFTDSSGPSWIIDDFADDGRVLATLHVPPSRSPGRQTTYFYRPADGLRPLPDVTHDVPTGVGFGETVSFNIIAVGPRGLFTPDGRIYAYNAFLSMLADNQIAVLREGSPISALTLGGVRFVAAVNQFDELIVFRYEGESWSVRRITSTRISAGNNQVLLVADPGATEPVAVVADNRELTVYRLNPDPMEPGHQLSFADRLAIVRGLTSFTNAEGVTHLVGFAESGDFVVFYRAPFGQIADFGGWIFDNFTQVHWTPNGIATPSIASNLTTYVTPWSGMNIAGVDENGHVRAMWWAPGLTYWQVSDLSLRADGSAPVTFSGDITAFVTPWNTLHINGTTDAIGHVAALWWAPQFGAEWQVSSLSPFGPPLRSETMTSYVTPWGGLNVVGVSSSADHVLVYWWSPESNEWRPEELPDAQGMPFSLTGRLEALVEIADVVTQNIYGRGVDGSLEHLFWRPDGNPWTLQNITQSL